MQKTKQWFGSNWTTTKIVWSNLCEFVDAACLASVSGFGIYTALQHKHEFWYDALLFAGLVIALQAFVLLVRHFNKPLPTKK